MSSEINDLGKPSIVKKGPEPVEEILNKEPEPLFSSPSEFFQTLKEAISLGSTDNYNLDIGDLISIKYPIDANEETGETEET